MRSGFAIVNKPPTMTSSDAVVALRRCYPRGTKVGHMGTLDPGAGGVLPIGVGKAARLFEYVIETDKEYIAEMALGVATDTQDRFGAVTARSEVRVDRRQLLRAVEGFIGDIMQLPPAYSAVKKDGQRLYQLARSGEVAQVEPRRARIDSIQVLSFDADRALMRIACGRGTYIRTLLKDIGDALGCAAHMSFLVRVRTGPFSIADSLSPEKLKEAIQRGINPLVPMDAPLSHLPALRLGGEYAADVRSGRPLLAAGLWEGAQGALRVYLQNRFAGIVSREGEYLRWKAMLLEEEGV